MVRLSEGDNRPLAAMPSGPDRLASSGAALVSTLVPVDPTTQETTGELHRIRRQLAEAGDR